MTVLNKRLIIFDFDDILDDTRQNIVKTMQMSREEQENASATFVINRIEDIVEISLLACKNK